MAVATGVGVGLGTTGVGVGLTAGVVAPAAGAEFDVEGDAPGGGAEVPLPVVEPRGTDAFSVVGEPTLRAVIRHSAPAQLTPGRSSPVTTLSAAVTFPVGSALATTEAPVDGTAQARGSVTGAGPLH